MGRIFWSTGPVVVSDVMYKAMEDDPVTKVGVSPQRFWSPHKPLTPDLCHHGLECRVAYPHAFVVEHWSGSWWWKNVTREQTADCIPDWPHLMRGPMLDT